jgi:hypothetical protein
MLFLLVLFSKSFTTGYASVKLVEAARTSITKVVHVTSAVQPLLSDVFLT